MRLLWHLSSLFAISMFFACSTNPGPLPDVGGSSNDTAEQDANEDTDANETATNQPDTNRLDTDEPDTDADTGDENTCEQRTDCPLRHECVEGVCTRECSTILECDDGSPCTLDKCIDEFCVNEPLAVTLPDERPGDCLHRTCVDGELIEAPYNDDIPADDGISCTIETCNGRYPAHFRADYLCDDGDDENGREICSSAARGCAPGDDASWVCEEFEPGWTGIETCDDGQDNNHNGEVDEGCECNFGEAQRCFQGPPASRGQGGCVDGYQQCVDRDDPHWGPCEGAILPNEEVCDAKDNSCNGCVDDLPDCSPLLTCPSEDWSNPLRHYALDATAIFGEEGVEWEWAVLAPPNSATNSVEAPNSERTSVYLDVSGDYYISLTVTDEKDDIYTCSWVVHAEGSGLRIEMRWDTFGSVDMDLHLHESGNTDNWCTDADCYYANCDIGGYDLAWGYVNSPSTECESDSSCPNPRLDIDNISGYDPENININNPRVGETFRIMAHMFSGYAETHPIISIYCGGVLRSVLGEDPDPARMQNSSSSCGGDTWRVADVEITEDPVSGATTCEINVLTNSNGGWDIRHNSSVY